MKASTITAVGQPVKQLAQKDEIFTTSKGKVVEQPKQTVTQIKETKEAIPAVSSLPPQRLQIQSPLPAAAGAASPFD